jgi:hypothetical protein
MGNIEAIGGRLREWERSGEVEVVKCDESVTKCDRNAPKGLRGLEVGATPTDLSSLVGWR